MLQATDKRGIFTTCYWAHSTTKHRHWLEHFDIERRFHLMTLFAATRSIKPFQCYEDRIEQLKLRLIYGKTPTMEWKRWAQCYLANMVSLWDQLMLLHYPIRSVQ